MKIKTLERNRSHWDWDWDVNLEINQYGAFLLDGIWLDFPLYLAGGATLGQGGHGFLFFMLSIYL